jgi:hypothetical protein
MKKRHKLMSLHIKLMAVRKLRHRNSHLAEKLISASFHFVGENLDEFISTSLERSAFRESLER